MSLEQFSLIHNTCILLSGGKAINVIFLGVAHKDVFDHAQFFKDLPPQRKTPQAATENKHVRHGTV